MANLHQKDKRSTGNPTIISFASPSVTPSNNYKQTKEVVKEANSSLILGRRIDSPKLRVQNEEQDRSSSMIQMMNMKPNMMNMNRDELFGAQQQFQQSMLNQTNKEIQQRQLDYSNTHTKANVTISYDTNPVPPKVQVLAQKSQKANKISSTTQKKRPQSMGPKHMATASMPNNHHINNSSFIHPNQPFINVQIKSNNTGKGYNTNQAQGGGVKKPDLKYAHTSSQLASKSQGRHRKNKSEGKIHSKGLQKQFNIVNYTSIINNPGVVSGGGFVFDNKENQSVNLTDMRHISPQKFNHPHQDQSISSLSSTSHNIQPIGHMNKAYFMDKGTLLKHLSPERSQSKGKTQNAISKDDNMREGKELTQIRSNGSTIVHQDPKPMKIKRPNTTNMANISKIQIKGVNKLIKDNLRKNKNKEDQEFNKQVIEDNKQKLKKIELSQRNQEVRKINASKIIMNHYHKNSMINQSVINKSQYKKKRSKSCMNKTDNIFSGVNKIKERIMNMNEEKREKKREKSFVLEMKELKRQIDDEIKRDIQAGRIDLSNGPVQRSNLSTINAKKESKAKKEAGNVSMIENKSTKFNKKQDGSFVQFKTKKKSKSKDKNINAKLTQFIEKQKKNQQARKSLEQTIENEKHLKIKENLHNLNNFVKNHFRHQSQNIFLKKPQNIQVSNNQGSKENAPKRKLKPQFLINKTSNKNEQILDSLKKEMMYDKFNQLRDQLEELSDNSPERQIEIIEQARDNDISNDFYGEYQKLIESIQKQQNHTSKIRKNKNKSNDSNNSHLSPAKRQQKQKVATKLFPKKQLKMKVQVPAVKSNEQELKNEAFSQYQLDSSPEQQSQMTVIKREVTSVIADDFEEIKQSSIISINKNIAPTKEYQNKNIQQNTQQKRSRPVSNNASPTKLEYQRKVENLVAKYGNKRHNDKTKLLIRLHSAAIMVQSYFRKYLSKKGFYDNEIESQMYIDSEVEADFSYRFAKDSTVKKTNQLPTKYNKISPNDHDQVSDNKKSNSAKLYGEDISDSEKIIVCSVISSVRQEEEGDNQSNRQQQHHSQLRQNSVKQQQNKQTSSSQVAKAQDHSTQNKIQQPPQQVFKREESNQSLSSSIKNKIPTLDLNKISNQQQIQQQKQDNTEVEKSSVDNNSNRHLFDRNSFREFSNKVHQEDFNMNMYPEMIKIREDAIKYREQTEGKYISKMYKSKQFSPRTYEQKRNELEVWVTKEKEDVKKTKKVFEEQWQKTTAIIQQTQKNQDHMKKLMLDSGRQQQQQLVSARQLSYRQQQMNNYAPEQLLSSYRMGSSRRESKLIDMINDNQTAEQSLRDQLERDLQAQIQQQKLIQQRELEIQKRLDQQQKDEEERRKAEQKRQEEIKDQQELQKAEEQRRKIEEEQAQAQKLKQTQREQEIENQRKQEALEKARQQAEIKLAEQKRFYEAEQKKLQEAEEARKQKERQQAEEQRLAQEAKAKQIQKELEEKTRKEQQQKAEERKLAEQQQQALEKLEKAEREQQRLLKEKEAEELLQLQIKKKQDEEEARIQKQQQEEFELEQQQIKAKIQAQENEYIRQDQNPPFYLNSESIHSQESDLKSLKQKHENRYDKKKREDEIEEEELKSEPDLGEEMGRLNSDMDIDDYHENRENQIIQDILDETNKNKQSLTNSHFDEKDKFTLSSRNDHKEEEPVRGLSRTRSSQYLKDSRDSEMSERTNSGDKNEILKQQFEDIPDIKEGPLSPLHKENFFTKNFDDERQDDLLDKMKNTTTDLKSMLLKEEELTQKNELLNTNNNKKIYVEDNEEVKLDDVDLGMSEEFEIKKQQRVPADMLSKIPVEDDEKFYPGMPVSPSAIDGGTDIRIQTGSQSLESTLSDDKKFKQLISDTAAAQSASDKEDMIDEITDDIFKYLMQELKVELDLLLLKDPRRMEKEEEQVPQNYFLSESGRFLIFERKGIKTDLFAIEKYVEEVLDETMKDKNKFLTNINQALSKKSLDVLNQLQNSEIGSYEHFEVNFPAVLPLDLYLRLEKRRKESREKDNQAALVAIQEANQIGNGSTSPTQQQQNNLNFLAECEHIHNKVLFDCINDSLLQFKPYGKDGSPLPWSRASRRLKPIEDFTVEEMFEIVKHDLFRWAIMQAGTLPRREFVFGGVFDDELFAEIREKKLATLLAREMIENEPKWLNYEFEEAQVKIDIGDMILEQLVTESITILNSRM